MQGATERLKADNLKGAIEDQEEALEALKQAQEEMEEEVAQKEEENEEDLAQRIVARLQAMLAEQELVSGDTRASSGAVGSEEKKAEADGTPTAESSDKAGVSGTDPLPLEPVDPRSLARRERSIETDAEEVLKLLERDEEQVVAPAILKQVKEDLGGASRLLEEGNTGEVTQLVQRDIEVNLRELIEVIRANSGQGGRPRLSRSQQQQQRQQSQKQRPKSLAGLVQELRMLRNTQVRLRERTERLAALGLTPVQPSGEGTDPSPAGEAGQAASEGPREGGKPAPAGPGAVEDQVLRLAAAEQELAELARKYQEKYPVIDALLLGSDPPRPDAAGEDEEGSVDPGGRPRRRGSSEPGGDGRDDRPELPPVPGPEEPGRGEKAERGARPGDQEPGQGESTR